MGCFGSPDGCGSAGAASTSARHDLEQHAIIGIQVTRHGVSDLVSGHVEISLQLSIEEVRVTVVESEFGDLL